MMMKHVSREEGGGRGAAYAKGILPKNFEGVCGPLSKSLALFTFSKKHTQFKNRVQKSFLIYDLNA